MSFWDHLDELRSVLIKSGAAILVFSIAAFCFKSFLFDTIILAPLHKDFLTYRLLGIDFEMKLVNIEISSQFMVHMRAAMAAGLVVSCPVIVYELWKFIAPALYSNEKSAARKAFGLASFLFYLGAAVGYFIVLPMCLNFFVDYQVSESVQNTISLSSYISLFMSMVLVIGLVFEFPMAALLLSSAGLISRGTLKKYRRHAIVIVAALSAVITPADPLSMIVLAIPLYLMYEFSILLCKK